jgi:hypothetical protein
VHVAPSRTGIAAWIAIVALRAAMVVVFVFAMAATQMGRNTYPSPFSTGTKSISRRELTPLCRLLP